ncbi:hypothetical protein [Variovorax sp. PAMC 28711]|uniref:hypothetical protein n=1 Tax=Variovorax sp. PAMC 28711 TaxID=1795631 RepID=UPI0012E7C681|nr:hypothetical protein [Variovorax sp. PAMC 28711]
MLIDYGKRGFCAVGNRCLPVNAPDFSTGLRVYAGIADSVALPYPKSKTNVPNARALLQDIREHCCF